MALVKIDGHAGRSLFSGLSGARRWVATFIATVASTYALDAIATVAGILLVASHVLQGFDHVRLVLRTEEADRVARSGALAVGHGDRNVLCDGVRR